MLGEKGRREIGLCPRGVKGGRRELAIHASAGSSWGLAEARQASGVPQSRCTEKQEPALGLSPCRRERAWPGDNQEAARRRTTAFRPSPVDERVVGGVGTCSDPWLRPTPSRRSLPQFPERHCLRSEEILVPGCERTRCAREGPVLQMTLGSYSTTQGSWDLGLRTVLEEGRRRGRDQGQGRAHTACRSTRGRGCKPDSLVLL